MSELPGPASGGARAADDRLRVLVVSRWLPAYDDAVRGSFVADQVAALASGGAVDMRVASFEFSHLSRLEERQPAEREALQSGFAEAARVRGDAATAGGWLTRSAAWEAAARVPIARLLVANAPQDPTWREADDHTAALLPFAEGPAAWSGGADLVHAHTGFPDGVAAAAVAERLGVPLVITEHASRTPDLLADAEVRRRYLAALRLAARVVAVSRVLADEILAALPEAHDWLTGRIVVLPNAVPLGLFRPAPPAERRSGELLYVGSRKSEKGIATLLAAYARVRALRPSTTLRLIGPAAAEDEARWTSLAAELGLSGAVSFEPAVDRSGVAAAMARADLFVHPSRRETFGVVGVEALASGLPVVATRSGGLEEILGDGPDRYGALVAVDDEGALADAVLRVLDERERFDPLTLRRAVEGRYAADAVAQRLIELYREVRREAEAAPREAPATARPGGVRPGGEGPGDARPGSAVPGSAGPGSAGPGSAARIAAPGQPDSGLQALVIAFNRVRAARALTPLPPELRERLRLVTVADPEGPALPPDLGGLLELDLDVDYRAALQEARPAAASRGLLARAARFARDPGASDRIAGIHAARGEYRLQAARRLISEEIRRLGRGASGGTAAASEPPDVLCVDGYDVMAAGEALRAGLARLAPGGMRWLADRWAAAGLADGVPGSVART